VVEVVEACPTSCPSSCHDHDQEQEELEAASKSWKEAVEALVLLVDTANMETQTQMETGEEDTPVSVILASEDARLAWKEAEALVTVVGSCSGSVAFAVAVAFVVDDDSVDDDSVDVARLDIHNSPAEAGQQLVDTVVAAAVVAAPAAAHVADRNRWEAEAEEVAVVAKTW
jgi:hypothetical protein